MERQGKRSLTGICFMQASLSKAEIKSDYFRGGGKDAR
jgi:hypothetical protein